LSIPLDTQRNIKRRRLISLAALIVVISLGVASRTILVGIPHADKELGDLLWPVMFYLIGVFCFPGLRPSEAAIVALLISVGTEVLQAYRAPWIDAIRDTRWGGLILGRVFSWRDMACYVIGAAAAFAVDLMLIKFARK
jgi:hypothetical protein